MKNTIETFLPTKMNNWTDEKCMDILRHACSLKLEQLRKFVEFVTGLSDLSLYNKKSCHDTLMNNLLHRNS